MRPKDKYFKHLFIAAVILLLPAFLSGPVFAIEYKDGVYVSAPPRNVSKGIVVDNQDLPDQKADVPKTQDQFVQAYIQQTIIKNVLNITQGLMQRVLQTQNLNLFPQIINLSIHQIDVQVFKQDETRKILKDAFTEAYNSAMTQLDQNVNPQQIKFRIDSTVSTLIKPLEDDFVFKKIFEEVLKQAQVQQQKIIMMQVSQRAAQLSAIQQRYTMMQQVLMKQYQAFINEVIKENLKNMFGG